MAHNVLRCARRHAALLPSMQARMKKDFEDQWAALAPAEQAAVKKKWKVCAVHYAAVLGSLSALW